MEINDPAAAASAIPHVVSSVSENVRERETYRSVEAPSPQPARPSLDDGQNQIDAEIHSDTTI